MAPILARRAAGSSTSSPSSTSFNPDTNRRHRDSRLPTPAGPHGVRLGPSARAALQCPAGKVVRRRPQSKDDARPYQCGVERDDPPDN
jgi:hypothetical protein